MKVENRRYILNGGVDSASSSSDDSDTDIQHNGDQSLTLAKKQSVSKIRKLIKMEYEGYIKHVFDPPEDYH
jgi:hypothetical protein